MTFKFSIGQSVTFREECYTIVQKRTEYGRAYYRLNTGKIVSELFLYA